MNKEEREEMKKKKEKYEATMLWMKIIFVPLIVGFALVYAKINIFFFYLIGWFLLIFGILSGLYYLIMLYQTHKEKIKKGKEEILGIFKKYK